MHTHTQWKTLDIISADIVISVSVVGTKNQSQKAIHHISKFNTIDCNPPQNAHSWAGVFYGMELMHSHIYRSYSCIRNWAGELWLGETKIPNGFCIFNFPSNFALILRSFDLFDYFFVFEFRRSHPFSLSCMSPFFPFAFRLSAHMLSM